MLKYRKYLTIWFLLLALIIVIDNYRLFGLGQLGDSVNSTFGTGERSQIIDRFAEGQQPTTVTVVNKKPAKNEYSWLSNYSFDGSPALDLYEYRVDYDKYTGQPNSYRLVNEVKDAVKMIPNTYTQGTKVALGAFFTPKFSRYGVNCHGCSGEKSGHGRFAVGVGADVNKGVRQFNGKYQKGITFEGYYIVAADKALPLCTVLEISNHNFKGQGLVPGVPFYAVVLDRGGAIKNNRLDFYIGDERIYNEVVKYSGHRRVLATIIAFGKRKADKSGIRSCKLPSIESFKANEND